MKMKKVLYTSHVANFSKFNRPFMRWFKEQGYEVHYASMGEEEVLDCDKHFTIPFERSPFKLNNLRAISQLKKIIDKEKYDIIHTHTPMGSVVTRFAALRTRKTNNTRVIYTAHGFHFFKGASLLNWLVFYPIEKTMARYTDILITINKEDYALAMANFKTDVRYVPGVGIDEKKFGITMTTSEKDKLRRSLGLKRSDFVMIYPAEISKRKNQFWLITSLADTIKNNSDFHLLLPGKDSLNGKCQHLANSLDIQDNIHFLGYRHDMPQLFKISNLAVSTASQEGLPVNIMEAMYAGLPIVATDCRGNRDLIRNNINGYIVSSQKQEDLVKKICILKENKDIRSKIINESKKEIKGYLLDKIMNSMIDIYLIGRKS